MISSRARYAVRALIDLSLNSGAEPAGIAAIAERQNIPLKFLQQILGSLRASGLVVSRKGPGGGYSLGKDPKSFTLLDVLEATDGKKLFWGCDRQGSNCGCPYPAICPIRKEYDLAQVAMDESLARHPFSELIENYLAHTGGESTWVI